MSFRALNSSAQADHKKSRHYIYEQTGDNTLTAYGVLETIYTGRTRFQSVGLYRSHDHGKLLILDGELQSASGDEFIYHETLVQPALVRCATPRNALVLGGAEGGTLRELLRCPSLESAVMVDIDGEVVELCQRWLPEQAKGAFEDPRTELRIGNALTYVENSQREFDLIISDLTEPKHQDLSTALLSEGFFSRVRNRLSRGGVFALQASEGNLGRLDNHLRLVKKLRAVFPEVMTLLVHIPSFACHWCFALASVDAELSLDSQRVDQLLQERQVCGLRFYDGQTDLRLRSLPKYLRTALKQ